jgi:hypothetical protein
MSNSCSENENSFAHFYGFVRGGVERETFGILLKSHSNSLLFERNSRGAATQTEVFKPLGIIFCVPKWKIFQLKFQQVFGRLKEFPASDNFNYMRDST